MVSSVGFGVSRLLLESFLWNSLTKEEQEKAKMADGLHLHERLLLVDHLRAHEQRREVDVFQLHMTSLETFLSGLKDYPPVTVTIARSIDGFMSIRDVAELETETFAMLRRVWGHLGLFQARADGENTSGSDIYSRG